MHAHDTYICEDGLYKECLLNTRHTWTGCNTKTFAASLKDLLRGCKFVAAYVIKQRTRNFKQNWKYTNTGRVAGNNRSWAAARCSVHDLQGYGHVGLQVPSRLLSRQHQSLPGHYRQAGDYVQRIFMHMTHVYVKTDCTRGAPQHRTHKNMSSISERPIEGL